MVSQGQAMGAPAVTLRRCPVCGRRLGAQDELCWMCGSDLTAPPEPLPVAEPVAEPVVAPQITRPRLPDLSRLSPARVALALLGLLTLVLIARAVIPRPPAPPTPTEPAVAAAPVATAPSTPTVTPTPTDTSTPTTTPTATATPTNTPTPTPLPPRVHTIQAGDTLLEIADQYDVAVEAILAANPGVSETRLQLDQELVIPWPTPTATSTANESIASALPEATAAPTAQPNTFAYTVQAGDTLSDIAVRYAVPAETIRQLNGLPNDRLQAGQTLAIPLPTPTPTWTPTPGPSPTPTPRPPYEAPVLLSPANNASLAADDPAVLQWTSVGLLGEGEWYQVTVINASAPGAAPYRATTKTTSHRLPPELQPKVDAPQTFRWNVVVVREAGTYSDGSPRYITLSPVPPLRTFLWQGRAPAPTPAGTP
jgi:LysM repeat protein